MYLVRANISKICSSSFIHVYILLLLSERIQEDENKDKHDHIQHRSKSRIRKRIIISDDEEDESESDDQSAVVSKTIQNSAQYEFCQWIIDDLHIYKLETHY